MTFSTAKTLHAPLTGAALTIGLLALPGFAAAQAACPDYSLAANEQLAFSGADLAAAPSLSMTAGGDVNISTCAEPAGFYGHVIANPDYRLTLSAVPAGSALRVRVAADCDTVLVANDYTGAWTFNDDGPDGSFNPEVILPASDGAYDLWVGTYDGSFCAAEVAFDLVSEGDQPQQDAAVGGDLACPDPGLRGAELALTMAELNEGHVEPMLAGGNIDLTGCAAALGMSDLAGSVVEGPDYTLHLTGSNQFNQVILTATAECDLVMLVNDATGAWHYNDDANGTTNPMIYINAVDGEYGVWVGTYGTELCEAQLVLAGYGEAAGSAPTGKPGAGN